MTILQHILIVESSADLRQLFTMLLERDGYRITCVTDGHSALAELATGKYQLILVDYRLPHMPGDALIDVIHQQGYTVKIVLMDYPPDSWVIARDHQADGFFRKSNTPQLSTFVAQVLNGKTVEDDSLDG